MTEIYRQKRQKETEWQYLLDLQNKIVIDIWIQIFIDPNQVYNSYSESCVYKLIQSGKQKVCLDVKTVALYMGWFETRLL